MNSFFDRVKAGFLVCDCSLKGKDKMYLTLRVQPRASKPGVERLGSREYKVRVLAPPAKGKANKEVIETLASYFGIPPSRVRIIRGQKSRLKLAKIELNSEGKENP